MFIPDAPDHQTDQNQFQGGAAHVQACAQTDSVLGQGKYDNARQQRRQQDQQWQPVVEKHVNS